MEKELVSSQHFPKDMERVDVEVNNIVNHSLLKYYEKRLGALVINN